MSRHKHDIDLTTYSICMSKYTYSIFRQINGIQGFEKKCLIDTEENRTLALSQ